MCLQRNVATCVSGNVDFVAVLQHVEGWKHHAGLCPETSDDDLLATGLRNSLAEVRVQPPVHGGSVNHFMRRKQLGHFRHKGTGEGVLRDRRNYGGNAKELRGLGEDLYVVENY